MMQDLKTLKQLVRLMVDNDLTELDLEGDGEKVRLRRKNGGPDVQYVPAAAPAPVVSAPAPAPAVAATAAAPADGASAPPDEDEGLVPIKCPMVGTFYTAPSPEAEAFVKVGDSITAESVVCIVEAMKVFNEIKAEASGVIAKILVENGQAVEFDQPLFMIKPS